MTGVTETPNKVHFRAGGLGYYVIVAEKELGQVWKHGTPYWGTVYYSWRADGSDQNFSTRREAAAWLVDHVASRSCKGTHTYSGLHTYEDRPDGSKVCTTCGKFGRYNWEKD
jgi:hypothetical protein